MCTQYEKLMCLHIGDIYDTPLYHDRRDPFVTRSWWCHVSFIYKFHCVTYTTILSCFYVKANVCFQIWTFWSWPWHWEYHIPCVTFTINLSCFDIKVDPLLPNMYIFIEHVTLEFDIPRFPFPQSSLHCNHILDLTVSIWVQLQSVHVHIAWAKHRGGAAVVEKTESVGLVPGYGKYR